MAKISLQTPLLLGSGSPRRREILESCGVLLMVKAPQVDERVHVGESADAYLHRIVAAKRDAVKSMFDAHTHAALLVADTSVIVDGEILGKPENTSDAKKMIARLAGRAHEVHTRFCAWSERGEIAETLRTEVHFRAMNDVAIDRYVSTGEGTDKAGAYAIQGRGAMLVREIRGSYTNVVGLPICEVMLAFEALGLAP